MVQPKNTPKQISETESDNESGEQKDAVERNAILIIKSKLGSLKGTESFLAKRDWQLLQTVDLRDAFRIMSKENPPFVMIPAEHPNPKMRLLPKLLIQAFPCTVIFYAENSSASTIKSLRDANSEYTLYPPVSGPAVERMILKIRKDLKKKDEEGKAVSSGGTTATDSNQVISIKGSLKSDSGSQEVESARTALQKLAQDNSEFNDALGDFAAIQKGNTGKAFQTNQNDGRSDGTIEGRLKNSETDMGSAKQYGPGTGNQINSVGPNSHGYAAKNNSGANDNSANGDQGGGSAYYPPGSSSNSPGVNGSSNQARGSGPGGGSASDDTSSENSPNYSGPLGRSGSQNNSGNNKQSQSSAKTPQRPGPETPDDANGNSQQVTPQFPKDNAADGEPDKDGSYGSVQTFGKKVKPKQDQAGEYEQSKDPSIVGNFEKGKKGSNPLPKNEAGKAPNLIKTPIKNFNKSGIDDSIIIKGTQHSLDESVVLKEGVEETEQISKCSRVACISVTSTKFNGYLIAALGNNREMDDSFIKLVRQKLVTFMRKHGEDFEMDDAEQLELIEVGFEDWAVAQAEFLRSSVHNGQEIAIAFFPQKAKRIELEISADQDMVKMKVDDIHVGEKLDFDVYVHLPANKKYVRYAGEGNIFEQIQKERLTTKGVGQVHLRKDSASKVHRYRVKSFLNEQIRSFKQKAA